MFLDAGAEEIAIVAVAALIFVGPKDLPVVLRKVGQFTAKMRGLAAEFRASFDEMARQSELDDLRREVDSLRRGDYTQPVRHDIDNHFEALHRELGAPPPSGFGAREGEVAAGPDAPEPRSVHEPSVIPTLTPATLSQDDAAARPSDPVMLPLVRPPEPSPEPPPERRA